MTITPEIKKAEIINAIQVSAKNAVECKLSITEEEVSSIIFVNARATLENTDCGNGEIRYGGKVTFYALLSSGGMKKCEAGVEFSYRQEIKDLKEGDIFVGEIMAENVKVTTSNGIPTASAMLTLIGSAFKREYADYVKELEGVNVKKSQAENLSLVACDLKEFDLEEEFDVDYPVNEVVWHGETLKVKSVSSGIGSVSIEGEAEICALLLLDDGKTEYFRKTIPFNFDNELKFAMPDLIATCKASVSDSNIKVVVDRVKGKSSVQIILKVCARTCLYENEVITFISDAYSEEDYLSVEKTPVKINKTLGESVIEKRIAGGEVSKFEKNTLLICPIFAKIEESVVVLENSSAKVRGVCRVGALVSSDGAYAVESALVPFEVELGEGCAQISLLRCEVLDVDFTLTNNSLTVDFSVVVAIEKTSCMTHSFVVSAERLEKRVKSNSAISVFVPNKGDTLWDVAKSLGVKEEDILKTNKDLTFPLSGEERIVIYNEL